VTPDAYRTGSIRYLDEHGGGLADATIRRVRASTFPGIRDPAVVAERLNLKDGAAYAAFRKASPCGIPDDAPWPDATTTYSKEHHITGASHKPPVFSTRSTFSRALKEFMPPGSTWYSDVSLQRQPDCDGNAYSRLFAEETTGYGLTYYAPRKDTNTLCTQLDQQVAWVATHIPGVKLTVLHSDFASEIARQNHGNDFIVHALSRWLDLHPGVRIVPYPPYSQSYNKSENTWGRIHGLSHTNARRARLGPGGSRRPRRPRRRRRPRRPRRSRRRPRQPRRPRRPRRRPRQPRRPRRPRRRPRQPRRSRRPRRRPR
jgi:hypothetical protein